MWRKLALIILALTLISGFTVPTADAGFKKKLKYLAALGLLPLPPAPVADYSPPPEVYYWPMQQEYVPNHWETTREWIPGTWERVWIPGHYDGWRNWVAGHYEDRQTPGRYVESRVRVDGYCR